MPDESLYLLMQSMGEQVLSRLNDPTGTMAVLMSETLRFRDKLRGDTGQVLTVEDTRAALDALEQYLSDQPLPEQLSPEQRMLVQIWIDRLTTFRR